MRIMNRKIFAITAVLTIFGAFIGPLGRIEFIQAADGYGPNLTINHRSATDATGVWADSTPASIGETVGFAVTIRNTNQPSQAENLTARVDLPLTPSGGTVISTAYASTTSETTVSGSQTNVYDSTSVISLPDNAFLQYKTGSLKVSADLNGDGVKEYDNYVWGDSSITTTGITLGTMHGGADSVVQLVFEADVVAGIDPNLTVRFLSNNPERPGDGWSDSTQANPGDSTKFYIEVHNTNVPSVAKDLEVRVDFDNLIAYVSHAPHATSVSDTTSVTFSSSAEMTYRSGSFKIVSWDTNGDGVKEYDNYAWPNDDLISENGITLGDLIGCNPYVIQLSFWADSAEIPEEPGTPQISINKKIVWNGHEYDSIERETHLFDPDESVVYKIYVTNNGDEGAEGVKVTDQLPAYIRTLDGHEEKTFDIGALGAGEEWSESYTAKVLSDLPQNDRTQLNTARVTASNADPDEDTAHIWINGPEILAEEIEAAVAEELPATGPEVPVIIGFASLLPLGVYLRKKIL